MTYYRDHLKARINYWLEKLKVESDKRREQEIIETLRNLARRLRNFEGWSMWRPIAAAAVGCLLAISFISEKTEKIYYYTWPDNYLRVVENVDPCLPDGSCGYRFAVQNVRNGIPGDVTEMHFCKSLQPRFEAGHTLMWIRYANLGSCSAIDGYDVLRDSKRLPVLAPNCDFDWPHNHIACDAGKAKF